MDLFLCGIQNLKGETHVLINTHSTCQFIQNKFTVYIAFNFARDKAIINENTSAITVNDCYPLCFSAFKTHMNVLKVLCPVMWINVFRRQYIDGLVQERRNSRALALELRIS